MLLPEIRLFGFYFHDASTALHYIHTLTETTEAFEPVDEPFLTASTPKDVEADFFAGAKVTRVGFVAFLLAAKSVGKT